MTVLVGNGSHGKDIAAIYERVHGKQLLALDEACGPLPLSDQPVYLGSNYPFIRFDMAKRFPQAPPPLIDPSAIVGPNVQASKGVIIAPHALLLRDVKVGLHTHINYGASMTRCWLGDFVTISPGVTICGDVRINMGTLIGAGAVICDRVTIGWSCVVGAGAVVLPGTVVPDGTTVVGVPAR